MKEHGKTKREEKNKNCTIIRKRQAIKNTKILN